MTAAPSQEILAANIVVPCADLNQTLEFFLDTLGFRIEVISPADHPTSAVISGYGVRLRLLATEKPTDPGPIELLVAHAGASDLIAPNGTRVRFIDSTALTLPPVCQSLVVSTMTGNATWGVGRASMHYRDLIPDRQGGRFIASHIRIPEGGPVPDYVHFHRIRFQMIYCYRGWVKVVYEDQGEPFILEAGDCVLQPPQIRHRVLESSPGLEVIEIGCPAEHDTLAEHTINLPTKEYLPNRDFGGQNFVRHQAPLANWQPWRHVGFEYRDLGMGVATHGLAGARVIRPIALAAGVSSTPMSVIDNEFLFTFILDGSATLRISGRKDQTVVAGDSFVIPEAMAHSLVEVTNDTEILEVSLPSELVARPV